MLPKRKERYFRRHVGTGISRTSLHAEWPKASLLCGTQVTRVRIDGGVQDSEIGEPSNPYRSIVTAYPYPTRRAAELELLAWASTVTGRDRTSLTLHTFKYQSIAYYNRIPRVARPNIEQFKKAATKWARSNLV